jgi:hypothetical protein
MSGMSRGRARRLHRLASILGFGAAGALLSTPRLVQAQESAPRQDGALPETPKDTGPVLVVVADLGGASSTRSAELRAALYVVARAHGYAPAGKVDVEGAASGESLMVAGRVTDEPVKLEQLRYILRVPALVRVSKVTDREGGTVRITVVAPDGFQTRILANESDESVAHALDVLLPRQKPTKPATEQGVDPETAELWRLRTGFRPTYGALAFASVTSLRHFAFQSANAAGTGTVSGTATAVGVGGGIGVRLGVMYIPELKPSPEGTFFTARFDVGLDTDFLYLRAPARFAYDGTSRTVVYGNRGLWIGSVPIALGGAVALGRFGEQSWHGALLGLAYAPELQYSMDLSKSSGELRFNPAGAEISVDITSLDASRGNDNAPQIRISVWGVAPLDDAHPWQLSLGLGAIWY